MLYRILVQLCSDAAVTAHTAVTAGTYTNQHVYAVHSDLAAL
jgi:hypothetical protein